MSRFAHLFDADLVKVWGLNAAGTLLGVITLQDILAGAQIALALLGCVSFVYSIAISRRRLKDRGP